jgi:two-component system response regulator FixJ
MTSTPTVAVIEDDEGVRESLQQLLRSADYDALSFASAEDYWRHPGGGEITCLIVDVNLPGMSGVELAQRLSARRSTIPIILITARDDPPTLELLRRAGPIPFLRKPFSDEQLFTEIARFLPDRAR